MSDAVKAEATGAETTEIEWECVTIALPVDPDDWDLEALEAFEDGKPATFVRHLLGDDYDRVKAEFVAAHGRALKVRDLGSLMESVATSLGFTPGE